MVMMAGHLTPREHSAALVELASRTSTVLKFGAGACEDTVVKVSALITYLITWLQAESSSDTSYKSYCDEAEVAEHSSKLETAVAKSIGTAGGSVHCDHNNINWTRRVLLNGNRCHGRSGSGTGYSMISESDRIVHH